MKHTHLVAGTISHRPPPCRLLRWIDTGSLAALEEALVQTRTIKDHVVTRRDPRFASDTWEVHPLGLEPPLLGCHPVGYRIIQSTDLCHP